VPERGKAIVGNGVKERLQLLLRPGLHLLGAIAFLARWVSSVEGVPRDVPPPDRVLAGLVQAGVDVVDCHGGEARLAILAVADCQSYVLGASQYPVELVVGAVAVPTAGARQGWTDLEGHIGRTAGPVAQPEKNATSSEESYPSSAHTGIATASTAASISITIANVTVGSVNYENKNQYHLIMEQ
jgi:hypothetical protein